MMRPALAAAASLLPLWLLACQAQTRDEARREALAVLCEPREISPSMAAALDHLDLDVAFAAFDRDDTRCHLMAATFIGVNAPPRVVVDELDRLRERLRVSTRGSRANLEIAQRARIIISAPYNHRLFASDDDAAALREAVGQAADLHWWVDVEAATPHQRGQAIELTTEGIRGLSTIPAPFALQRLEALAARLSSSETTLDRQMRPHLEAGIRRWRTAYGDRFGLAGSDARPAPGK